MPQDQQSAHPARQKVSIGEVLLEIETDAAAPNSAAPAPAAPKTSAAPAATPAAAQAPAKSTAPAPAASSGSPKSVEFKLPLVSEGVNKVDVAAVHVKVGDVIKAETNICDVETDKAVAEIACPYAGTIEAVHVKPGTTITIGTPLVTILTSGSPGANQPAPSAPAASPAATPAPAATKPAVTSAPATGTALAPAPATPTKSTDTRPPPRPARRHAVWPVNWELICTRSKVRPQADASRLKTWKPSYENGCLNPLCHRPRRCRAWELWLRLRCRILRNSARSKSSR